MNFLKKFLNFTRSVFTGTTKTERPSNELGGALQAASSERLLTETRYQHIGDVPFEKAITAITQIINREFYNDDMVEEERELVHKLLWICYQEDFSSNEYRGGMIAFRAIGAAQINLSNETHPDKAQEVWVNTTSRERVKALEKKVEELKTSKRDDLFEKALSMHERELKYAIWPRWIARWLRRI